MDDVIEFHRISLEESFDRLWTLRDRFPMAFEQLGSAHLLRTHVKCLEREELVRSYHD